MKKWFLIFCLLISIMTIMALGYDEKKEKQITIPWNWESFIYYEYGETKQKEQITKEKKVPEFPNKKQLKLIGRIARGIAKNKEKNGWWICGKLIQEKKELEKHAIELAYKIVQYSWEVSGDSFTLNPWGLLGTIYNESRFDRCALGLYPRKKAYDLKLIKKRKRCISHSEKEILNAVKHPKMQRYFFTTGVDLGLSQMLSRFYENKKAYEKMISLDYGIYQAAREMRHRARRFKTKRPWLFWRGYECDWYDKKITKHARKLGANKKEI